MYKVLLFAQMVLKWSTEFALMAVSALRIKSIIVHLLSLLFFAQLLKKQLLNLLLEASDGNWYTSSNWSV